MRKKTFKSFHLLLGKHESRHRNKTNTILHHVLKLMKIDHPITININFANHHLTILQLLTFFKPQ
ncbi:hypothetical protein HanRHA438_Chr12g0535821 [Helianthus annuus]|nr:hypothetical protein HanRHA438_Chr12g0535821 [Helianthus annuus]